MERVLPKSEPEIIVPQKLPLLEGLCWNIANPYALTPQEMLGIYEERWHYLDVLGSPSEEEKKYIQAIGRRFRGLPLVMENQSKQDIFDGINTIIQQLDRDLFVERQVVLGGGALIGLKYQQLRALRSQQSVAERHLDALRPRSNLDFLVSPKNFQRLRAAIKGGQSIFTGQVGLKVSEPRIDRYGIRYPLFIEHGEKEIALKLEIIADAAANAADRRLRRLEAFGFASRDRATRYLSPAALS